MEKARPKGTDGNTDVCPVKCNYAIPCTHLVFSEFIHSYNSFLRKLQMETDNGSCQMDDTGDE